MLTSFLKLVLKIPQLNVFGLDDALIFGGLAAAGGLGSSAINASSAQNLNEQSLAWDRQKYDDQKAFQTNQMYEQFRLNTHSAREQMDFQRDMSNTAYQRSMADMKAAGLNPMLAFMKGGADSPGGAQAQASTPSAPSGGVPSLAVPRPGDGLANIMGNLTQMMSFKKDMQSKDAQIALTQAQAEAARAQTSLSSSSAKKLQQNQPAENIESKVRQKHGQYDLDWAAFDAILDRFRLLIPFTSPKSSGKPPAPILP